MTSTLVPRSASKAGPRRRGYSRSRQDRHETEGASPSMEGEQASENRNDPNKCTSLATWPRARTL
eukprot:9930951-Alexandrium_andersonii.AAC.1